RPRAPPSPRRGRRPTLRPWPAARRNPERLSGQQIAALRAGASTLAANKRLLAADQGAFAKKLAALRKHKRTGNCQTVLADLEAIIALQQARLKNLRAVSAALDDLLMAF
ncbi:MAG: hypothetical protein K6U74_06220, partial [Firmicutes bacterium]|nr:hypothetical protein [Bacillota bacterium]